MAPTTNDITYLAELLLSVCSTPEQVRAVVTHLLTEGQP